MPGAAVRRFIEEAVGPQDHPEQATTMNKILVVYKRSAFELYSESRDPGVRDFMARPGADVKRMERSHRIQKKARARVTAVLDRLDCQVDVLSRGEFKGADGADLVITVGGDGTFLHVSHAVRNVPMVGVNTDPNASVGFFCTATAFNFDWVMRNLENLPRTILHRMEVTVDGQALAELALNDAFYAHENPAAVTRYRLRVNGRSRYRKSSGLLVCTAAGSTGWMYQEGGEVIPIDDSRIQYISRSVRGETPGFAGEIMLQSLTREAQIFVDGTPVVTDIPLGAEIILRGGHPLTVVGDLETKRKSLENE